MISREEIQAFVDEVVKRFRPAKVILFGSYACGTPTEDSDVDLMVVMRHRGSAPLKAARIMLDCVHNFPLDLLVRSPAQLRARLKLGDTFMREIQTKGFVLHEGDHARKGR
jgi:predicted nucleotidyltransferase